VVLNYFTTVRVLNRTQPGLLIAIRVTLSASQVIFGLEMRVGMEIMSSQVIFGLEMRVGMEIMSIRMPN
jgi:hypothetical protein